MLYKFNNKYSSTKIEHFQMKFFSLNLRTLQAVALIWTLH